MPASRAKAPKPELPLGVTVKQFAGRRRRCWIVERNGLVLNAAATKGAALEVAVAGVEDPRALDWHLMDEGTLQRRVLRLLGLYDFRAYHTFLAYRSEPGYPDVHAWRPRDGRSLFLELKTMGGTVSEAQQQTLTELAKCRQEVYVVRPDGLAALELLLSQEGAAARRLMPNIITQ